MDGRQGEDTWNAVKRKQLSNGVLFIFARKLCTFSDETHELPRPRG